MDEQWHLAVAQVAAVGPESSLPDLAAVALAEGALIAPRRRLHLQLEGEPPAPGLRGGEALRQARRAARVHVVGTAAEVVVAAAVHEPGRGVAARVAADGAAAAAPRRGVAGRVGGVDEVEVDVTDPPGNRRHRALDVELGLVDGAAESAVPALVPLGAGGDLGVAEAAHVPHAVVRGSPQHVALVPLVVDLLGELLVVAIAGDDDAHVRGHGGGGGLRSFGGAKT